LIGMQGGLEEKPKIADENRTGKYGGKDILGGFLGGKQPEPTRRAEIARQLADCYRRLNQPGAASTLYWISLRIEPSNPQVEREIDALRAQMEQKRSNDRRRPVITANL